MEQVSIAALRKDIGRYLDRVVKGEELSITRRGKVIAKLSPSKAELDLSDMDEYYDQFDYFEKGNAVVEAREEYRY
jgi:prevent-host-death family protein